MSSEVIEWCGDARQHEPHRSIGRRPGEHLMCLGMPFDDLLNQMVEIRDRHQREADSAAEGINERAEAIHASRRSLL